MSANFSEMRGNLSASTPTLSLFELLDYRNGALELILMYWWAVVVGNLLLFAFAKHSLMRWELRQDRRRLECCNIRSCQRRRAVRESKSAVSELSHCTHSEAGPNALGAHAMATSPAHKEPTEAEEATTPAGDFTSNSRKEPRLSLSEPKEDAASRKVVKSTLKTALRSTRRGLHEATAAANEEESRPPLPSATASDLSFSTSPPSALQATSSATARLLKRISFMSHDVGQSNDDRIDCSRHSNSGDASSRLSNCCPRYSEDEQRLIDKKRQENVHAWMEAKRALELTESLAAGSGSIRSLSSVTLTD
ncbi:hypothetical protein GH5_01232 [Leishmania sp. Ghana 2012 LV757]|uniref:hypothetical protein n=1 Tax=Leishmania sp. Ghana 2012 LV757 TaxID=2803181 RepID=UPI001B3FFF5A|nr:hypothetical protein GH5_01232 [Leishmania sp. Ghana 2012 LV757]